MRQEPVELHIDDVTFGGAQSCEVLELMEKSEFWLSVVLVLEGRERKLQFLKSAAGIERKYPLEIQGYAKSVIVDLFEVGKVVLAVALSVVRGERCVKYQSPEREREDIEMNVSLRREFEDRQYRKIMANCDGNIIPGFLGASEVLVPVSYLKITNALTELGYILSELLEEAWVVSDPALLSSQTLPQMGVQE